MKAASYFGDIMWHISADGNIIDEKPFREMLVFRLLLLI